MNQDTTPKDGDRGPDTERDAPADHDAERRAKNREADEGAPEPSTPFDPKHDDDSEFGDTDEHSTA